MSITAKEIEEKFTIKQMIAFNQELRSRYNDLSFKYNVLVKKQDSIIEEQVKRRTRELDEIHQNEIENKNKEIEKLKETVARLQLKIDTTSENSGIPTSKTPIGRKKYIPNCREKSNKKQGGQEGHKKHKLEAFTKEEATEIVEISEKECPNCNSKNIEVEDTGRNKCEIDYEVKVIKRMYIFKDCHCNDCGKSFQTKIPERLKEANQYGSTLNSLAICLNNEFYTPFNKVVKLIKDATNDEIKMSEGYVVKLQKNAANKLTTFMNELKEKIAKSEVYGWDDGVISVNTKNGILRTYCTDKLVCFFAHEKKNEDSLDEDGILLNTSSNTIVMHDHLLHNYNEKYNFENVECLIHLIRRLKKSHAETQHNWCIEMIELLSKTNKDRNYQKSQNKDSFSKEYLNNLSQSYDEIIKNGKTINQEDKNNYFIKEEKSFLSDLKKYKENYLLWTYKLFVPSTNNDCEREIRPVKSKMKISGQFKSINTASYYATIRSYIETCKKAGINIIEACKRLDEGNPYTVDEILEKND